ncbi:MAG: alpha/beta hydrolase [Mycobacterium sp.]
MSANSTPDTPEVTPAAWVLLAAARRELNQTMQPRTVQAGGVVAEREAERELEAAASTTLAPGIVVPPELSDKVTATGRPSLMDIITVRALEVIKRVSQFIGVNVTMQLGRVITTPTPPWFTTIGLDVTKDTYEGGDVWVISRPNPTDERVIAVHGSGFIFNPNIIHWMDYAQMARETGATVIVPRYPLIPNGGNAANSVPAMADFIANEVETYGAENVSIYADSAGGNLSTLAVQKIVRECGGNAGCLAARVPSRMVLLSPALDGKGMQTDPNAALTNDPVVWIPAKDLEYYSSWSTGPEELWNPMLGPTHGMPPTVVYVGSREQSAPGALLYAARLVNANPAADISVVIGMGQIHDWAQGGYLPINSQAANYRRAIYRQLGIVDAG